MQTTVEETDKHVVRLSVEIEPDEVAKDLDRAYRKVAGEVKIPGFRKGKVPKQVIDARVGREHVLEEFVKDAVPAYYFRAVREHNLAPIADPEIDLDQVEDGKSLKFTATVEVRPRLTLEPERYRGVHVMAPSTEPTELEIDAFVDRLRERFAELEVVERPARKGDQGADDPVAHAFIGSKNEIVERLATVVQDGGVDALYFWVQTPMTDGTELERQLELLASEVVPQLRSLR